MSLRVLTYNVKYVRPHGWSDRLPVIADVIQRQSADVIALQECVNQSDAEWLAHELNLEMEYGQGNHRWSEVWLSRLPIQRGQSYRIEALVHGLLEIQVTWDGGPLRLFTTHLRSLGPQSIMGVEARRRAEEVRKILNVLQGVGEPHLLCGDFNAARPGEFVPDPIPPEHSPPKFKEQASRYYHVPYARKPIQLMLDAGYADCYWNVDPKRARREKAGRIDFIFASADLAPRLSDSDIDRSPGTELASDHPPVWAEFS